MATDSLFFLACLKWPLEELQFFFVCLFFQFWLNFSLMASYIPPDSGPAISSPASPAVAVWTCPSQVGQGASRSAWLPAGSILHKQSQPHTHQHILHKQSEKLQEQVKVSLMLLLSNRNTVFNAVPWKGIHTPSNFSTFCQPWTWMYFIVILCNRQTQGMEWSVCVHSRSPSNLTVLELFYKEEWANCTLDVQSWWRHTSKDLQL